jgi:hypothetical protein
MVEGDEARAHIDKMAKKYLGSDTYPWYKGETRIIVRVEPEPSGITVARWTMFGSERRRLAVSVSPATSRMLASQQELVASYVSICLQ